MTKIALLHFDFISKSSEENLLQITDGIELAVKNGAEIILTPEMALQGYHFFRYNRLNEIPDKLENTICLISKKAKKYGIYIFIGTAIKHNNNLFNSYVVINKKGEIIGRHDKKNIHGISEKWADEGIVDDIINISGKKYGTLICVDAYYEKNVIELKKKNAEIILIPSAWVPDKNNIPENYWIKCSNLCGNSPVIVCNQTGKSNWLDCTIAKSMVINNSEIMMSYSGRPAILLFDFDFEKTLCLSSDFCIIEFQKEKYQGLEYKNNLKV